MARFKSIGETNQTQVLSLNKVVEQKNYPFKNLYASVEDRFVYINMEAIEGLSRNMVTLRDIAIILDISGSMNRFYLDRSVERLCCQIVDTLAPYDDDGIDIYFFAKGLVYQANVKNAEEVRDVIQNALLAKGAYGSTMPTEAFKVFCEQIQEKQRGGTVLFLTDGAMDDGGRELKNFYASYLHTQFKTRDNFYCYAIEFGQVAYGALNVLDGLFQPEQGPEDLFDLESASNLENIASVLAQVGGMSAIGSDVLVDASCSDGAFIDMVNADLINDGRGTNKITGPINKNMSFRVQSDKPFVLNLNISGYTPMKLKITQKGVDADIELL